MTGGTQAIVDTQHDENTGRGPFSVRRTTTAESRMNCRAVRHDPERSHLSLPSGVWGGVVVLTVCVLCVVRFGYYSRMIAGTPTYLFAVDVVDQSELL